MMLLLSLVFIGCTINENSTSIKENEGLLVDDKSKINTTSKEDYNSLNNTLSNKNSIPIDSNIVNITDLKTRNTVILNEYIRAIGIVKKFCLNNSLNLTYIEPISDRALKLKESYNGEVSLLLNDLSNSGAETVNYFTNDDPNLPPVMKWRAHANLLYSNWLNYFVYQTTPYDLSSLSHV